MPEFVVTRPDGKEFVVEAPEGATEEQALQYAKRYFAGGEKPPHDYGLLPAPVAQFAYGFNEKIADLYDAPGKVMGSLGAGVRSALGLGPSAREKFRSETPDPISAFLRSGTQAPVGPVERIARRAGEEIGVGLPLAAVPFGLAARPLQQGMQQGGNLAQRAAASMIGGIQSAPVAAGAGELAATMGAGLGAGAAREMMPGSPEAESVGQILGGIAPGVATVASPTAMAGRFALNTARRFSPGARKMAAQQEAAKVIGPTMTPEAQQGLAEAEALRQAMPGFSPSLAEATKSQSLAATQARFESAAAGPELEAMAQRRAGAEQAVTSFARGAAPETKYTPAYVVDVASARVNALQQRIDDDLVAVARRREQLAEGVPGGDRVQIGQALRGRLAELRQQTRDRMGKMADDLGLSDVDLSVPFTQFRNRLVNEFAPKSIFEDAANEPAVMRVIRDIDARDDGGQIKALRLTFADVKALRERVSDDLIDAIGKANPSRKEIRSLSILKRRVDEFIDDVVDNAEPGIADRWRTFRQEYFNEYISRFEKGAAFKVEQKDGRAFYRTPDEKVAATFFAPGEVSAARQFNVLYRDDPAANVALRSHILDDLRTHAVRDGELDPRRLAEWTRRHESVLNEFPDVRQTVADVNATSRAIAARQGALEGRARQIEDTLLVKELSSETRTPEQFIDRAVNDPRRMFQLWASLRGEPDAQAALRRHVWDKVADGTSQEIDEFILKHDKSLRVIFNAGHLGDLRRISAARGMLETVPPPRGAGYEPNPLKDIERSIGMGIPQLASRIFAVETGRTSARYVMTDALGRFFRGRSKEQSAALLKEALYNPEVARDLATMSFGGADKAKLKRLNTRLFNLGAPYMADDDQEKRID